MNATRKVALVTGGSRGIGRAASVGLSEAGVQVVVNYFGNEGAAKETLSLLHGDGHIALRADVSDADAVRNLVDSVVDECGSLDILVNNAGVFEDDNIVTTTYDEWQQFWAKSIGINLLGIANASHRAIHHMMQSGGGRIVNVGSRGAYRGDPEYLAYVATKAGAKAMAQSLAMAVAKKNIFVATVAPGFVDTDMAAPFLEGDLRARAEQQSPMGRIAEPEEIAKAIVFLALEAPAVMTGCVLDANGASWIRP